MNPAPEPSLYPTLAALYDVLTAEQWNALFANRLAKRSAMQKLIKHQGVKPSEGDLNRLTDDLAQEMRRFRPIKPRQPGDKFVMP